MREIMTRKFMLQTIVSVETSVGQQRVVPAHKLGEGHAGHQIYIMKIQVR